MGKNTFHQLQLFFRNRICAKPFLWDKTTMFMIFAQPLASHNR